MGRTWLLAPGSRPDRRNTTDIDAQFGDGRSSDPLGLRSARHTGLGWRVTICGVSFLR